MGERRHFPQSSVTHAYASADRRPSVALSPNISTLHSMHLSQSTKAPSATSTNNNLQTNHRRQQHHQHQQQRMQSGAGSRGLAPLTEVGVAQQHGGEDRVPRKNNPAAVAFAEPSQRKRASVCEPDTPIVCCGRGHEQRVARTIFNVLDMEGDNKVSWTEFCLFVKHSYEHFPALVQSFSASRGDTRDEVSRFRRLVLSAVMGDAIEKEELLVWEKLQDDVLEVLFEGSRKFEGKGFVTKTRRVFRRFDTNDSGAISFSEFNHALHALAFFDFNTEVRRERESPRESGLCVGAVRECEQRR